MFLYVWFFITIHLTRVVGTVDTEDTKLEVVLVVDVDATVDIEVAVVDFVCVMYC